MQIVSIDVNADFLDDLLNGKQGNTPHGKGSGKVGCSWKRRNYQKTVEAFLDSKKPVMLVLLDDEDVVYHISSGFMECIRRHEIKDVKARVRKGFLYLVRTDREEAI